MSQMIGNMFGGGYATQRANGRTLTNLRSNGGLEKAAAWRAEVKAFYDSGMSYPKALQAASAARKQANPAYQTMRERTIAGYKGHNPANVKCTKPMKGFAPGDCPAKHRMEGPSTEYRPGRHLKRHITQQGAAKLLRDHYRQRGLAKVAQGWDSKEAMKWASTSMRRDIGRTKKNPLTPCGTRAITYTRRNSNGTVSQVSRPVVVTDDACRDNWLYRGTVSARNGPSRHDIRGVDHGQSRESPAWGKRRTTLSAGKRRVISL